MYISYTSHSKEESTTVKTDSEKLREFIFQNNEKRCVVFREKPKQI